MPADRDGVGHSAGILSGDFLLQRDDLAANLLELVALFLAGGNAEAVATLGTVDVLVPAHERRGHRAGRDHERFGFERAKQKRQHERDDDRLDRFANRVRVRLDDRGHRLGWWPGVGVAGFRFDWLLGHFIAQVLGSGTGPWGSLQVIRRGMRNIANSEVGGNLERAAIPGIWRG